MNRPNSLRRVCSAALALTLVVALSPTALAFALPWNRQSQVPTVADFAKNGVIGSVISFGAGDFVVQGEGSSLLSSITIRTLPQPEAGTLVIGGQPVEEGCVVDSSALSGLRFQVSQSPAVEKTTFTFTPTFSCGRSSADVTVTLHLLAQENRPPLARNMDLTTYKNVAITGYFDAVDTEGDPLTFQLTSTPARGAVTVAQDGSSRFVYTPYENKTGSDSFTYVAVDPAGNTSSQARITVRIDKAGTHVTYADLEGHSAHKAAIRLAQEGIYVGQCVDGQYFFEPDAPVSRARFLTMAMAVAGLEPLEGITLTGFYDDGSIPTWAKGAVSAALMAGAVQGSRDSSGAPVFQAQAAITRAEASVMLNSLLHVTDVPTEVFFDGSEGHWAAQAAANLSACGVLGTGQTALSDVLTLGESAELLDRALDLAAAREDTRFFG